MDLLKRITTSVVLAVPVIFAGNAFAGAHTTKATPAVPTVHYSGSIGLALLGLDNGKERVIEATQNYRPELNMVAFTKMFGADATAFTGFKVSSYLPGTTPYTAAALKDDYTRTNRLSDAGINMSKIGFILSYDKFVVEAGLFPTRSMAVVANNFSPVSVEPTNISNDLKMYAPKSGQLPVAAMVGNFLSQGKATHIGVYNKPIYGFVAGLDYVPVDYKNNFGQAVAKQNSLALTLGKMGESKSMKYDVRLGYATKLLELPYFSTSAAPDASNDPFLLNKSAEQASASAAVDVKGVTGSLAFSKKFHKNHAAGVKDYTALDLSLGYSAPVLSGLAAVKLGFTRSTDAGVGFNTFVEGSSTPAAITANKTDVISLGATHDTKAVNVGLFVNRYANKSTAGSTAYDDNFYVVEAGAKYLF